MLDRIPERVGFEQLWTEVAMDPRPPEKKRQARRRRVRLPAVARVPKPAPAKTLRKDGPTIAAEAVATTAAHLRDVAASIRAGDTSRLAAVYPRGIGTTVRGLRADECGQYYTVMIEGVECHHYLPDNRLCWWETWEQKFRVALDPQIRTGAVSGSERGPEEVFLCEFSPALASVVGAGLNSPGMLQYGLSYDYFTWELFHDGVSLNAIPALRFFVATRRPGSIPVIRTIEAEVGPQDRVERDWRKVLVNAAERGYRPDPTRIRPPLVIVFETAQRAVGLEYGFLSGPDGPSQPIHSEGVVLIAYDADGREIAGGRSTGVALWRDVLHTGKVDHRIGVRDENGGISSVEFRFTTYNAHTPETPGDPIIEPQIVYRIWHEAFPPAAVQQGTLETGGADHGCFLRSGQDHTESPVSM